MKSENILNDLRPTRHDQQTTPTLRKWRGVLLARKTLTQMLPILLAFCFG
ncbi:MAG: hypothetical protein HYR56_19610, partial [Acidobacteria bacterium]|nr:hypothetical protein [Acidobacteriota bacterium]